MATSNQIKNIIKATKVRIARLTRELSEAKKKVTSLDGDLKKTLEAEKKTSVPKKAAPKKKAAKKTAKKK